MVFAKCQVKMLCNYFEDKANTATLLLCAQPALSPPTAPACEEGLVRLAQRPGPLVCAARVCGSSYKTTSRRFLIRSRFLIRRKGNGGAVDRPDALAKGANLPLVHTFGCRSECDRARCASHTCQRPEVHTRCAGHPTKPCATAHHLYKFTRRRTRGESITPAAR